MVAYIIDMPLRQYEPLAEIRTAVRAQRPGHYYRWRRYHSAGVYNSSGALVSIAATGRSDASWIRSPDSCRPTGA